MFGTRNLEIKQTDNNNHYCPESFTADGREHQRGYPYCAGAIETRRILDLMPTRGCAVAESVGFSRVDYNNERRKQDLSKLEQPFS
jgi:hypothetical protein